MRLRDRNAATCALLTALALTTACKTTNAVQDAGLRSDGSPPAAGDADVAMPALDWAENQDVQVEIGNSGSFAQKIKLIESATKSIRIGYFIFGFDDSSSYLVTKLLERAAKGVDVRIMVDGMTSQQSHDNFQMVIAQSEKNASSGQGKPIQVMYFRPIPDEVWADLASWGFKDRADLQAAMAGLDPAKLTGLIQSNPTIKDNPAMKTLTAMLAPGADGTRPGLLEIVKRAYEGKFPTETSFDALTDAVFKDVGNASFTFHPKAWINMLKRFHHKLLIVDDQVFMGGGRNVEDHYHVESDYGPLAASNDLLHFMDADVFTSAPKIVGAGAKTFDDYWTCADNFAGCKSKIAMARERPEAGKAYDAAYKALSDNAARYSKEMQTYTKDPDLVLHDGSFKGSGVKLAYLENRMAPARKGFEKLAFGEEPSHFNAAWEGLMANAKAGDDVVIHNAYMLPPPAMQIAIFRAVKAGAKVRVITNSETSSNHGVVNVAAKAMYAAMLNIAERIRKERGDSEIGLRLYLYQTRETLHTKIGLVGEYMIVGSTNADPRSKLMDTQNGVLIGPGANGNPVADQYRQWLESMLTRQRGGKPVIKELTLQTAQENIPPLEQVKANPADYRTDQQFDAYAAKLFETAMDPATDRPTQLLVSGFLNTLFLML